MGDRYLRRRADRRRRTADDSGITLLEVMVAMALMSVIMALFSTGIVQIHRSTQRAEAGIHAQTQLAIVFSRLDREVRYATEIGPQGDATVNGVRYWYVEYVAIRNAGEQWCFQMRVPTAQAGVTVENARLETRSWRIDGPAGAFSTLASSVQPASANPFSRPSERQLRVRLGTAATAGPQDAPAAAATDVTFTAMNATGTPTSVARCALKRTELP